MSHQLLDEVKKKNQGGLYHREAVEHKRCEPGLEQIYQNARPCLIHLHY